MRRKVVSVVLTLLLVVAGFSMMAEAQEVKDPETITKVTISNQNTLDPHFSYDTGSGEVVFNVYENLISYKGSSVTEFEPLLSTKVPSKENGLINEDGTEYTFVLREGVEFSNGNELTPEDVKYSFIRGMIQDRSGGPIWMLYEPLIGKGSLSGLTKEVVGVEDPSKLTAEQSAKVYERLDETITIDGNKITFHLPQPYPPFLNLVAHGANWAAILDKEWTIEQGGWDGSPETIAEYYDPAKEDDPLYDKMMGTGPFVLEEWKNGEHVILKRNENYWREPANFKTAIIRTIDEFSTRKLMLTRGDADMIVVPRAYLPQFEEMDNVTVKTGFPVLQSTVGVMNWEINMKGNDNVGSGKLDGNGIPADFFNDKHIRKAFSYAFNYKAFMEEARMGLSIKAKGPIVQPLLGYDEDSFAYTQDLEKAEEHFKKAFDGEVWEKGFEMTVLYNSGNDGRKIAADMVKAYVEQINPKFDIKVRGVQWSSYLDQLLAGKWALGFIGWLGDFPDPHNFVSPYLASDGTYGAFMGDNYKEWAEENVDPLIEKGITTVEKDKREEIYEELQSLGMENATMLWVDQPVGRRVFRDWLEGWYPNTMRPGIDFYSLDK